MEAKIFAVIGGSQHLTEEQQSSLAAILNLPKAVNSRHNGHPAAVLDIVNGSGALTVPLESQTVVLPHEAEPLINLMTGKWNILKIHIADNPQMGVHLTGILPADSQNIAFEVDPVELQHLLKFTRPQKLAIIFCINDHGNGQPGDDTLSIVFAGVKQNAAGKDVGAGHAAIEKWPGLFSTDAATGAFLNISDKATAVKANLLTLPAGSQLDAATFNTAAGQVDDFVQVWNHLLTDTGGAAVGAMRPDILLPGHPLAFFSSTTFFETILNTPGLHKIAGVFGYDTVKKYINPFFIGIDKNQHPITPIVYADVNAGIAPFITVADAGNVPALLQPEP